MTKSLFKAIVPLFMIFLFVVGWIDNGLAGAIVTMVIVGFLPTIAWVLIATKDEPT